MSNERTIEYEVTRDDWLGVNAEMSEATPYWSEVRRAYRRKTLKQSFLLVPGAGFCAAMFVGGRSSTQGMYIEGALAGMALGGLIVFGLVNLDVVTPMKKQMAEAVRRSDLSSHVGRYRVEFDETGVRIVTPSRELTIAWTTLAVHVMPNFIMIAHGGNDGTVIPKRAFTDFAAADAFAADLLQCCTMGQRTPEERVVGYLRDRDVECPKCRYNLRGCRGMACPECGETLTLQALVRAKQ